MRSDVRSLKLQLPEVKGADSFVEVPLPQLAASDTAADSAALRRYQDEKGISDSRLQKRVTLAKKAVSFGDLLDAIAKETGVNISATRSVADDKLTVFCKDKPLRELMRMITQHFGFVWERTGSEPQFVYRLKQPLRNQFLEEELRNKDKNEALLALDREMESLKKYFEMSPEETRAAAESAQGKEKEKLEMLGGIGWGPSRLYAGLVPMIRRRCRRASSSFLAAMAGISLRSWRVTPSMLSRVMPSSAKMALRCHQAARKLRVRRLKGSHLWRREPSPS